jgi:hypothetical protein
MYLDPSNRMHDVAVNAMECPHCRETASMLPTATPDFRTLQKTRPEMAGMAFQCDACNKPVFYRFRVQKIDSHEVVFQPQPLEVEKPDERFSFRYLPERVAGYFRDALGCYHHGLILAFAAMCRHTTQAIIDDLGQAEKQRLYAQLDEIAELANLDEESFQLLRSILFDGDTGIPISPDLDRRVAGILLETMKDMLQQAYIRRRRLRRVLQMRQYFADTRSGDGMSDESLLNVSDIKDRRPTGTD